MRPSPRNLALAIAVVASMTASPGGATILRAIEFDRKVEQAEAIILGKCVSQSSHFDTARNWILTTSTFRIEKTLKGQPAHEITIVTPGGTAGDVTQEVVGVPKFRPGDEHLLFVRGSSAGPTVLYLEQGAYRVGIEEGDKVVVPMVSSPVLVDTGRGRSVAPERPRRLREFETAVRDTMKRREALRMEMIERKRLEDQSLPQRLRQNAPLVVLALVGALLASWQIYRRW